MLAHMQIHNFAIVKKLELDFQNKMTTITGETGAGKSIAIDALGLCLGERADPSVIRPNEEKAEIVAQFDLSQNLNAKNWLKENELLDGDECILRRVITKEGRSRAFINGRSVPASQQKALGQHLIHIHGQHAHQALVKTDSQLAILDSFAANHSLLSAMKNAYQQWRSKHDELEQYKKNKESLSAQQQLLEYQIKELNELKLQEHEFSELEAEHKKLSNAGDIAIQSQAVVDALSDNEESNALSLLKFAEQKLKSLSTLDSEFTELCTLIEEACIQIQEASWGVNDYINRLEIDPNRLSYLDDRLALILRLARKHQVSPIALYQTHQKLIGELDKLQDSDNQIEHLTYELQNLFQHCLQAAQKLTQSRMLAAKTLGKLISTSMHSLNMHQGQFVIEIKARDNAKLSPSGMDDIAFLVSTNSGQPVQSLAKVASGGELSRISLAIQVITAQKVDTPSLIFDEVDVGISGATATVVGKLLRQLGESTQVLCVTHLPQVAGCGHQHMLVNKTSEQGQTTTSMVALTVEQRIQELARLLGGSEITAHTLANAKELLVAA